MGIGGVVTSLAAVLVSLVALPALLAVLGPRVNSLAPAAGSERRADRSARAVRPRYRLSRTVMRRPVVFAVASSMVLIVMALPALRLEFTGIDLESSPEDLSARQVDDALRRDFDVNLSEITVLALAPRSEAERVRRFAADLTELPGRARRRSRRGRCAGARRSRSLPPGHARRSHEGARRADPRRAQPVPGQRNRADRPLPRPAGEHRLTPSGWPRPLCCSTFAILFLMTGSVVLPLKSLLMNRALGGCRVRVARPDLPGRQPGGPARLREPGRWSSPSPFSCSRWRSGCRPTTP